MGDRDKRELDGSTADAPPRPGAPAPPPDLAVDPLHETLSAAPGALDDTAAGGGPARPSRLTALVADRFELLAEIGRGGMGRVLAARDRLLGRTVAVKLLLAPEPDGQHRFEREALLTARLQHPGIVPVYDAGKLPSGELYYAMKLVSGRTLKDLIAERKSLVERLALLPNLLAAAEAVGYAHQHGVMHRDLKPSNIVVGEFGESQVIDWGLAKELGSTEREPAAVGPASGEHTSWGAIIGTPAFMAPEQARGLPVDERADVWSLGATLYMLLAGEPPYGTGTTSQIVKQVSEGHPAVPLLEREPNVPRELAAVVAKAMERDPGRRYASARELAEDLRRFQTGKLVAAHRYSTGERLGRWVARHRAAVVVSAVSLAALVGLGAWSLSRIVQERDAARRERTAAVNERRAAEDLVRFLLSDLRARLAPIGRLELLEGVGERVERYYQNVAGPERPLDAGGRARRAEALDGLSKVRRARGQLGPALLAAEESLSLRMALAAAAPKELEPQLDLASAHLSRAVVLNDAGRFEDCAADCRAAVDEVTRAAGPRPGIPALERLLLANLTLGGVRFRQGRYQEALTVYAEARAIGARLAPSSPSLETRRLISTIYAGIGRVQINLHQPDQALEALHESARLQEKLVADSPGDPTQLRELGGTLTRTGQVELERQHLPEAHAALERGLQILQQAADVDRSDVRSQTNLTAVMDQLASLEREQGRYAEALRRYEEALAATRSLVANGGSLDVRYNLVVALQHVGMGALDVGDVPQAVTRLRESVAAAQAMLAVDAKNDRVRNTGAESRFNLGDALVRAGDRAGAHAAYAEALADFEALAKRDPSNSGWRFAMGVCRAHRGALALAEGRAALAVELLRAAVASLESVTPGEVEVAQARADLATALGPGAEATALRQKARAQLVTLGPRAASSAVLARDLGELAKKLGIKPAAPAR